MFACIIIQAQLDHAKKKLNFFSSPETTSSRVYESSMKSIPLDPVPSLYRKCSWNDRGRPLVCDCHDDEVAVGEHVKLVIVLWWSLKSSWGGDICIKVYTYGPTVRIGAIQ